MARSGCAATLGCPRSTRVYVVVPEAPESAIAHIRTPRLVHPEQAREFKMEVLDEAPDASL